MPSHSVLGTNGNAEAFMMAALLVYGIVAAACSSPQTTEINAGARADTLMKWVMLGMGQAAIFIMIAAFIDKEKWPVLLGGGLAGAMMWTSYAHAKSCGLKNGGPTTEQY
jgi:hypothetical protein